MKTEEIISLLLPEGLQEFFEITKIEKNLGSYIIHLEENNSYPEEFKNSKLESKGFYEPVTVQDFPLRGKACYFIVKRRRWTDLSTGNIVSRNWDLVANGTRLTKEFADFLKAFNR